MEKRELQQIKARAEQVGKLLGKGSEALHLIEDEVPKLVAEVERLAAELGEAGQCPHGVLYKDRSCVECFGDGTEEMLECSQCGSRTWHRGGKCVRHDTSAPRPYDPLRIQLKQLQGEIQTVREQFAARVAASEERAKKFEAEAGRLREEMKPSEQLETELKRLQDDIEKAREQSSTRVEEAEQRAKKLESEVGRLREELKPHEQLKTQLKQLQAEIKTVQERASIRVEDAEARAKKIEAEAGPLREELKSYEQLKNELRQLQDGIQRVQERADARVGKAEAHVKEVEATCAAMREALEYVKGRIGSVNIGESLIKIDQALSSPAGDRTVEEKATK